MNTERPIIAKSINPWYLILLFALLQLIVALCAFGLILSYDESMWHYIGRNWFTHGLTPYTGGVDNKSPLIFAIFGLSDALFGVNYWFPRTLGIICQSAGMFFIYQLASRLAGRPTGIIAITIYGLSLLWHVAGGKFVSYTETWEVTCISAAFYYALTGRHFKRYFISGCAAGIAFGFRLPACFGIMAIVLVLLRHNKKGAGIFLSGVLTAVAAIAAVYVASGISLYNVYVYGFADNFGTGSTTDHSAFWRLNETVTKFFQSELVLFYPFVAAYCFIKRKMDALLIWLLAEFIGIHAIGVYSPAHFKVLLPALSIISAIAITTLINTYKIPVKPVMFIIWIVFFPKLAEPLLVVKKLFAPALASPGQDCLARTEPDDYSRKNLGLYIRSATTPQQRVLVVGYGTQIHIYTERLCPSVYFNTTNTKMAKQRFFNDIQLNKPDRMLVPAFPEYEKYIAQDIRSFISGLLAKDYYFDRCMYGYNIFHLKP